MLKLFVCGVCGEPYLGENAPDECPFCGAPEKFIGLAGDYSALWGVELTEQERADMKATLGLEVNATAYYDKVSKSQEKYSKYNRLFKQLARVELEHADLAAKFLGVPVPALVGEDVRGIEGDLKRTKELEAHAVEVYEKFLANASSERVKKLYTALIHAESGHRDFIAAEL
ncbi:MAG: hypothetical protein JW834_01665 [Candidatus Diapherotrites archaeon]|nr:hypothetical protein [Candidatus Diapherotrites archaeon]